MTTQQQLVLDRALELMDLLGQDVAGRSLRTLGWSIRFDRGKKRLGACTKDTKTISLSRHHSDCGGVARMEQVIRHEIAHAIDVERRGRTNHDEEWKRVAVACGAKPTACVDLAPREMDARYRLRCWKCKRTVYLFNKPRPVQACGSCSEGRVLTIMEIRDLKTGVLIARSGVGLSLAL